MYFGNEFLFVWFGLYDFLVYSFFSKIGFDVLFELVH